MTEEEFPSYARSLLIIQKAFLNKYGVQAVDPVVILKDGPNAGMIWPPELREEYLRYKAERERKKKP